MYRDHRCLTECQKQNRQDEPAGQVDVTTRVEVSVTRSRTCVGTTDVSLPVKKQHRQNELAGQEDIPTRVEVLCDTGFQTHVGTTDISWSVKNNIDRRNQLVR